MTIFLQMMSRDEKTHSLVECLCLFLSPVIYLAKVTRELQLFPRFVYVAGLTPLLGPSSVLTQSRSDQKVAKNQIKSQQNKNPFS